MYKVKAFLFPILQRQISKGGMESLKFFPIVLVIIGITSHIDELLLENLTYIFNVYDHLKLLLQSIATILSTSKRANNIL